ncbi:hypothetical protein PR048_031327 [Dryococelus australis]|uniref:Integrase catalytic domain-containing protein n=1 Tax=Dryococelus australis TaxID=614101 RepID=A0ABQ9G4Y7_9NEOP|nr:hypothetical protein PR048_031327 [Dryococelus australis]
MPFRTFASNNGIRLVTIAPYHPSSNGQAERIVQTTKEMLQRIKGSDLAQKIARLLLTQHVTPNATIGSSLAELLLGRRLWTCLDRVHSDFLHEMRDLQKSKGIQTAPRRLRRHIEQLRLRYSSAAENIDAPVIHWEVMLACPQVSKFLRKPRIIQKHHLAGRMLLESLQMSVFLRKHQRGCEVNPRVHVRLQKVRCETSHSQTPMRR